MGRRERAVIGGLLTGLGQGLVNRDRDRREEERLRREEIIARLKEDRQFKRQSGLLASTQPDEEGNVRGVTRGGDVIDLGFKAAPTATSRRGELTDAQRIADAKARYTITSSDDGREVTDWTKVDAYLASKGRPDLAAPRGITGDTSIDKNSDEWDSAEKDAEKWAKDQERFWSFDTTVFEQYGGETQAIRDKTMEYYLADKGVAPSASKTKPTESTSDSGTYKSAEDVGEAYRNGLISKDEAERILQEQFGI